MSEDAIAFWTDQLKRKVLADGGFASDPRGNYRVDATCWAILALAGDPANHDLLRKARARLAADQLPDGRVGISLDHPEAFWPTALAILAWHQSPAHQQNQARAAQFLIGVSGTHPQKPKDSPVGHDTAIQGWSWTAGTRSWVEPTALAMLALSLTGYGNHARVEEGVRLLLDRQLPRGGWNYGNPEVFGRELRPMPLDTGMALNALENRTPPETIRLSLDYLQSRVTSLRTPRSLGWSLLGLAAWQARPVQALTWIAECLRAQERYGLYDTPSLALLLVAWNSPGGLTAIWANPAKS